MNELFEQLAGNASRNFKIEFLMTHRDNKLLQDVICLALDPFTQFYIRKIPSYYSQSESSLSLADAIAKLGALSSRQVTGHAGIAHLKSILERCASDDAKVIERIIEKDLGCGVSSATVNVVWPGIVAEYPCMLCSQFEQKLVDKIEFPAYFQLKMDGMRFNAIVINDKCEFRSRNGKHLELHGQLQDAFIALANGDSVVFDGELVCKNPDGSIMNRQTGNGILNKANKGTISVKEADSVYATVWDMIPYDAFMGGYCSINYFERYSALSVQVQQVKPNKIAMVEHRVVLNFEEAKKLFEEYLSKGQEGGILKDPRGVWENKRAKHQIKFKQEEDLEAEVVGWTEGTGKYQGMMGSLMCRSKDIEFSLGSGFNEEQRREFTEKYIVGKIITCKYNSIIVDKRTGVKSLFLPVFVEERLDKVEV